jgi:predicted RecB family endonuclease
MYPVLRWIHAIPNGGHRHVAVAKRMKAEGVKAGILDICIPIPVDEWAGAYVEMKYGKGRLTNNQKAFIEAIQGTHKVYVCYSWTEAAKAIGDYLGIEELKEVEG